jgi:hypothetical protein
MSTTTKNTNTAFNLQPQQKIEVTGEQEAHRLREAQNLRQDLQGLLMEGDAPNAQLLEEALKKAEQLISESSSHPSLDPEAQKTLEDLSELLTSARKLGKNKGIADRLQKIAEESAKALEASRRSGVSADTKKKTEDILNYITESRPLFYLLVSSRDFRRLVLDTVQIARRVVYSYGDDIREETKQKFEEGASAQELGQHVKERTKQKEVPEMNDEEWDTLQEDFQRVLLLLSREPSYREGVDKIFSLLDMFQRTIASKDLTSDPLPNEPHFRSAVKETEKLVTSFSGKDTFERFKTHLKGLIEDIQQNEKLHSYLSEVKGFLLESKSEEEIRSEQFKSKSKDLAHRGRELMRELREKQDLDAFFQSANDMLENIKNDEMLSILRHHAGVVQSDISYEDSEGNLHLDTDMLSKLNTVLVPALSEALKYIPLPRIESHNSERDLILDNVILCGYDILPDKIRFRIESDSEVSIRDVEVKGTHTNLVIHLDDLRTELKDVDFVYNKKTFPKFDEKGKATFRIGGNGAKLTLRYEVEQGPNDKYPRMKKGYASFFISDMSIDFDTNTLKHDIMVPMLTSLFKTQIKNEIEREIENNLTGWIEKLGDMMTNQLSQLNRPFLNPIEAAKKAVKSSQFAQIKDKRSEKLE